ncbi:MAG: hypothetical protein ACYC9R_13245 [Nitrosotalea sp.]
MEEQSKTREERIAELLEQPALDAVSKIKGPSLADVVPVETKAEEEPVEEDTDTGGQKVRIPKSRLKTLTTKVSELEKQVQETQSYRDRVAALEAQLKENTAQDDLPDWWKEQYGDTELSRKGYENTKRVQREILQQELKAMEEQREAAQAERQARVEAIERSFDEQMADLEETLGRELTDNQKGEIMEIVEEYSPLDDTGKYESYIRIAKAYEIWQKGQGLSQSKQEMARIAGSQSSGGVQTPQSNERPQVGDWRKKYNL